MARWEEQSPSITDRVRGDFITAVGILRNPGENLEKAVSHSGIAFVFLLVVGGVTVLLTPFQLSLGFEDVNGLHAGGQAEYLSMEVAQRYELGIPIRMVLIEVFYILVLAKVPFIHLILKVAGGKGRLDDTFKMICYGDAPGWIPYFATCAAVWAAAIQLIIGPVVIHKISWAKACLIFCILTGLAIIDIATPLPLRLLRM